MHSEQARPKVFIVVLNYNGGELLQNCLASLDYVSYPNFSIVIVDNASADGSLRRVRANFPQVTIIENEKNLGFSGGNNVGIKYALEQQADYVLLLNQDTEVEPDFLEKLIVTVEKNPQIGILSPLIFWEKTDCVWFSGGRINWWTMKAINETRRRDRKYCATGFISGCSMLIKKAVIEKVGLLDEKFFLYYEDVDFSCRAQRAGFLTVIDPASQIYHFETSGAIAGEKLYQLVFSGLLFFKKNSVGFMKIWISFYYKLRKLKNRFEMTLRPNEKARIVQKAYYDFEHGK